LGQVFNEKDDSQISSTIMKKAATYNINRTRPIHRPGVWLHGELWLSWGTMKKWVEVASFFHSVIPL